MKLTLLLPGWMFAAGLLAGETAHAAEVVALPDPPTPRITVTPSPNPAAKGLHFANAPAQALRLVTDLISHQHAGLSASGWVNGVHLSAEKPLTVEPPLALYRTVVMAAASRAGWASRANLFPRGNMDADTTLTGYEYDLMQEGELTRTIQVQPDTGTGEYRLRLIGEGPFRASIPEAVKVLAGLKEVQADSFEVRVLTFNAGALGTRPVLWLKSTSGGTDLIYELSGIASNILYTAPDFLEKINHETLVNPFGPNADTFTHAPPTAPAVNILPLGLVPTTITGIIEYKLGAQTVSQPAKLTMGKTTVIPMGGFGITAEITPRIQAGRIIYRGGFKRADANGKLIESFVSGGANSGGAPPDASFFLKLRDLSITFTAPPFEAPAPGN